MGFRLGQVAQAVYRRTEVAPEAHAAEFRAKTLKKEGVRKRMARVVPGGMPGRTGLLDHIVSELVPEARLPQGAEQVQNALFMDPHIFKQPVRLEGPALGGGLELRLLVGHQDDLGLYRKVGVEPTVQKDAFRAELVQKRLLSVHLKAVIQEKHEGF